MHNGQGQLWQAVAKVTKARKNARKHYLIRGQPFCYMTTLRFKYLFLFFIEIQSGMFYHLFVLVG